MPSRRELLQATTLLSLLPSLPSVASASITNGPFPYHPVVWHLDLVILAYQMYGQSLVWPFDPYYEDQNKPEANRRAAMQKVWAWANSRPSVNDRLAAFGGYRGPGSLAGFPANELHDPIIYRYDRLNPAIPCLNFLGERWARYQTPAALHQDIHKVYVVFRAANQSNPAPQLVPIRENDVVGGKTLFCFEGGTGDKGEPNQPHSQSLMGCILLQPAKDGSYTVHIAFRGSRSGKGSRSMRQAYSDHNARGNPDWVTDFGTDMLPNGDLRSLITATGDVCRGFAHSIESMLPNIFTCLKEIASQQRGVAPKHIYITGHSLGGALGQHFVSAMLMGKQYGPIGSGPAMPDTLKSWPWESIKLITFGAPRAGDEVWARTLTTQYLQNDFFSTRIKPTDDNALSIDDPQILERLHDPEKAVCWRVLDSTDPITTEKVAGGKHIGKTVYTNTDAGTIRSYLRPPSTVSHELVVVRRQLLDTLGREPMTETTWTYHSMPEINPARDNDEKGSTAEYQKMMDAIVRFYQNENIDIDLSTVEADFKRWLNILDTH